MPMGKLVCLTLSGEMRMTSEKIFYEMSKVNNSSKTPKEFDYLFVSLNDLEERAWSAVGEISKKAIKIHQLIVFDFYGQEDRIR